MASKVGSLLTLPVLAFLAVGGACFGRGGEAVPPAAPVAKPTASAPVPSTPGLPALAVAEDDPRLAGVRDLEVTRDFSGAARAVEATRAAAPQDPRASCAWAYLAGRLHLAANEAPEAAAAFETIASAKDKACPLFGYASLRSSEALARAGRWQESLARARQVPDGEVALDDEVRVTLAEALAAVGDRAGAVVLWRRLLTENPHGARWVDTAVRLATALLDGVDGPPSPRAREALDLATRVMVEAPRYSESSGASALRARAVVLLRGSDPTVSDVLPEADRLRLAQAWLDLGEAQKALTEINAMWPSEDPPRKGAAVREASSVRAPSCKLAFLRAQATGKTKRPAADAWGDAIRACTSDDQLPAALYQGAKSSAYNKRSQEAVERYAKLEHDFPSHRLADDARYQAALLAKDQGDDARFAQMMLALPEDFPEGDMRGDALFRVALARMTKGDFAGAREPLERIEALFPDDRHWATAGRASYFLGRAAEVQGDRASAVQRYTHVIETYPLAYYMTQAYARLATLDLRLAQKTLADAVAKEPAGDFLEDRPELRDPGFLRACRLLEVGEVDAARRELARAGLTADNTDHAVLWSVAALYDRAHVPELGHSFTRGGRLTEHLAHYPAGRYKLPWEIAYPRAFAPFVERESAKNAIPTPLTWAIMREESTFVAEAKSPADAYGLMQLIVPTARLVARGTGLPADPEGLKRPDVSIALGTRMLAQLRGTFAPNRSLAIAAYNGGPGAVQRWIGLRGGEDFDLFVEEIPFDETRNYIKRVLGSEAAYAFLYAREALDEVLRIPARVGGPPVAPPSPSDAGATADSP